MSNAWEQAKKITDRNAGGVFIRLRDGESFIGVMHDPPLATEERGKRASEARRARSGKARGHGAKGGGR